MEEAKDAQEMKKTITKSNEHNLKVKKSEKEKSL